jgi:hypothetical protein
VLAAVVVCRQRAVAVVPVDKMELLVKRQRKLVPVVKFLAVIMAAARGEVHLTMEAFREESAAHLLLELFGQEQHVNFHPQTQVTYEPLYSN